MDADGDRASLDGLRLLENSHMIQLLLYVDEHDNCRKNDIYNKVSHNSSMPKRIDALSDNGLIVQIPDGRGFRIALTDKGRKVADLLRQVSIILANEERCIVRDAESSTL